MPTVSVVNGLDYIGAKQTRHEIDPATSLETVLQQLCTLFGLKEHHSHFCLYKDDDGYNYLTTIQELKNNDILHLRPLPAQAVVSRAENSLKSPLLTSQTLKHLNDHLIILSQQEAAAPTPVTITPLLIERIVMQMQSKPYFIDLLVRIVNRKDVTIQDSQQTAPCSLFVVMNNALEQFEKRVKSTFFTYLLNDAKNEGMVLRCVNLLNRMLELAPDSKYVDYILAIGITEQLTKYLSTTSVTLQQTLAAYHNHMLSALSNWSTQPLDLKSADHAELLERVWYVAFSKTKYPGPDSDDWRFVGFEGVPEDNFDGHVMGLENMAYFAMNHSMRFRTILLEQSESSFTLTGYPMGSTSARITSMLCTIYRIGTNNNNSNNNNARVINKPIKLLFGSDLRKLFNELYCATFEVFEWLWMKASYSFPEYMHALYLLQNTLEKVYTHNWSTLKEFEKECKEKLEAEITASDFAKIISPVKPAHPHNREAHLTKFFGEVVEPADSARINLAPQPSNVKSFKLKKMLGANADIKHIEGESEDGEEEEEEDEESKAKRLEHERALRLRGFFGEWFDMKEVELSEKLKPLNDNSTPLTENAPDKLERFFGEPVKAPPRVKLFDDQPEDPEAATRRSAVKVKSMLGENVDVAKDTGGQAYAAQPAHVKSYKLDRRFGEKVPQGMDGGAIAGAGVGVGGDSSGSDEGAVEDKDGEITHHKRLQKYFGERFDLDEVVQAERLRPREDGPVKAVQPGGARVDKIHRFFGERMSIRIGEGGEGVEDDEYEEPLVEEGSLYRARRGTVLKVRRQLGEGIDVEKETTAVNFAPQPVHVKAYKLDKMFGQRVPHSASDAPGSATASNANANDDVDGDDDDVNIPQSDRERRRRLQTFFGERFEDLDKIVAEEKLKAGLAGELKLQSEYAAGQQEQGDSPTTTANTTTKKKKKLDIKRVTLRPSKKDKEKVESEEKE